MMLYFQNPGQSSEFVIDGSDPELFRSLENDLGDSLSIASEIDHIRMGARVRAVSDSGDVLFIGSVVSIEYSAVGGQRRYDCIAAEALLQYRYAPEIIYPGGVGLTLSDIFSSDAPPQGAGATQYCMGLLWLSRSKICDGQDTGIVSWDSDGVGTLEGWGPLVTGHDIYYGGHLLAESTLSAITGGTYRYAISGGNLYIRGAGAGAIYDVIAADGWTENHVRLGTVATDSEVEAPYEVGETDVWSLIRDLVSETGQYVVFRREEDYVYLDISATPKARGSESAPHASLHIGDDFSLQKISPPRYIPYSCVVGMGAGAENIEGVRYARGELLCPGQAWLETTYQLPDARLPPWGHLDQATDDFYDAIHQHAPVEIDLYRGGMDVGDWIELDLEGGEKFAAQIRSIRETIAGEVAVVGSPDLNLRTAFWERVEGASIEAYRQWQGHSTTIYTTSESDVFVTTVELYKKINIGSGYLLDAVTLGDGVAVMTDYDGKIHKTEDWGFNWRTVYDNDTYSGLASIAKWDDDTIIVGTEDGHFLLSTDGGESWSYRGAISLPSGNTIRTIGTFPNGIALAGGDGGNVFKTVNYGANWWLVFSSYYPTITKIRTWPEGTGLVTGDSDGTWTVWILRFKDYGDNWDGYLVYETYALYNRGLATWGSGRALFCGGDSAARIWRAALYGNYFAPVYSLSGDSTYIAESIGVDEDTRVAFAGIKQDDTRVLLLMCEDISGVANEWKICADEYVGDQTPKINVVWPGDFTLMVLYPSSDIYIYCTCIYKLSYVMSYPPADYTFHEDEQKLVSISVTATGDDYAVDAVATAKITVNDTDTYVVRFVPAFGDVVTDMDISTSWKNGDTNYIKINIYVSNPDIYNDAELPHISITMKGVSEK